MVVTIPAPIAAATAGAATPPGTGAFTGGARARVAATGPRVSVVEASTRACGTPAAVAGARADVCVLRTRHVGWIGIVAVAVVRAAHVPPTKPVRGATPKPPTAAIAGAPCAVAAGRAARNPSAVSAWGVAPGPSAAASAGVVRIPPTVLVPRTVVLATMIVACTLPTAVAIARAAAIPSTEVVRNPPAVGVPRTVLLAAMIVGDPTTTAGGRGDAEVGTVHAVCVEGTGVDPGAQGEDSACLRVRGLRVGRGEATRVAGVRRGGACRLSLVHVLLSQHGCSKESEARGVEALVTLWGLSREQGDRSSEGPRVCEGSDLHDCVIHPEAARRRSTVRRCEVGAGVCSVQGEADRLGIGSRRGAQSIPQRARAGRGTPRGSLIRAVRSVVQGVQGTVESMVEGRHHAEDRDRAWEADGESSQAIVGPECVVSPKVIRPRGRRAVRLCGEGWLSPGLRARQEESRHSRAGDEGGHERPEAVANGRRPARAAVVQGLRQALSRQEGGVESPGDHGGEGGADSARVHRGVGGYSPGGVGRGRAAQVVVVRALHAV